MISKKFLYLIATLLVAISFILSACGGNAAASGLPLPKPTEVIQEASKQEGVTELVG